MPVLLAHAIEDSTNIFGISGGFNPLPRYATVFRYLAFVFSNSRLYLCVRYSQINSIPYVSVGTTFNLKSCIAVSRAVSFMSLMSFIALTAATIWPLRFIRKLFPIVRIVSPKYLKWFTL